MKSHATGYASSRRSFLTTRGARHGTLGGAGTVVPLGVMGASELNRKLPPPIPVSDAVAVGFLAVLELIAIWCVIRIWRERGGSVAARLLWTAVTLVPVLGLIAYAAWRDPPPPKDPTERPRDPRLSDYFE